MSLKQDNFKRVRIFLEVMKKKSRSTVVLRLFLRSVHSREEKKEKP